VAGEGLPLLCSRLVVQAPACVLPSLGASTESPPSTCPAPQALARVLQHLVQQHGWLPLTQLLQQPRHPQGGPQPLCLCPACMLSCALPSPAPFPPGLTPAPCSRPPLSPRRPCLRTATCTMPPWWSAGTPTLPPPPPRTRFCGPTPWTEASPRQAPTHAAPRMLHPSSPLCSPCRQHCGDVAHLPTRLGVTPPPTTTAPPRTCRSATSWVTQWAAASPRRTTRACGRCRCTRRSWAVPARSWALAVSSSRAAPCLPLQPA
jgi:hypothetical protein